MIDRITHLLKIKQLSSSKFADEIGVQRSGISHILSGRNKPSLDFIQKILERYPEIDAGWLVSGKGEMQPEQDLFSAQAGIPVKPMETHEVPVPVVSEKTEKTVTGAESNSPEKQGTRKIEKIMILYSDHSFEEFTAHKD